MSNSEHYRAKSTEFGELIKGSDDPSQIRKLQDSKDSFSALADNEEWVADNFDKTVHEKQSDGTTLAAKEEYVLRCLGASVILQWNKIPTKLQRELFDAAGSMGELLNTAELRGQIARFLHEHKDDGTGSALSPKLHPPEDAD